MDNRMRWRLVWEDFKAQAMILVGFLLAMWFMELVDQLFFRGGLDALGIRPRSMSGLRGILLAPFLHGGFGHLIANTVPFLVLGWFVMLQGMEVFWRVTAVTLLISGLGIWLFGGARTVHIGASGLIFGYFGYLLLRGYFERSPRAIAWAVIAVALYGGMVWGILPLHVGISWQAHLFGLVGGGVAAYTGRERPFVIRIMQDDL